MKRDGAMTATIIAVLAVLAYAELVWMPMGLVAVALGLLAAAFLVFAAYSWKETARDEREAQHISKAGRGSYLVGAGILTAGITVQTLQGSLSLWLPLALVGMVLAKVVLSAYYNDRH